MMKTKHEIWVQNVKGIFESGVCLYLRMAVKL